jgi:hypothetical protein
MTSKVYLAKPKEKSKLALKNLNVAWMYKDTSDAILKWMQNLECKESEDRGMQEVTFEVETITPLFLAGRPTPLPITIFLLSKES